MTGIFPHTVTIEAVGRDLYGKANVFGAAVVARAMVVPGNRKVTTGQGEERVSRVRAICQGPIAVPPDSAITVPAQLGMPARMPVIDVRHYTDPETYETAVVEVYA